MTLKRLINMKISIKLDIEIFPQIYKKNIHQICKLKQNEGDIKSICRFCYEFRKKNYHWEVIRKPQNSIWTFLLILHDYSFDMIKSFSWLNIHTCGKVYTSKLCLTTKQLPDNLHLIGVFVGICYNRIRNIVNIDKEGEDILRSVFNLLAIFSLLYVDVKYSD